MSPITHGKLFIAEHTYQMEQIIKSYVTLKALIVSVIAKTKRSAFCFKYPSVVVARIKLNLLYSTYWSKYMLMSAKWCHNNRSDGQHEFHNGE